MRKRPDSQYLYLNFSVDGKRVVRRTKYTHDQIKKVKKEVLPLVRAKILSGEIVVQKKKPQDVSFEFYCKVYLQTKERTLKPSTYSKYVNVVKVWSRHFKGRKITSIKLSEIKEIVYSQKVQAGSIKQYLGNLRGIFEEAVYDEVIPSNPCKKIKPPRDLTKKEVFPFTSDEVITIIDNASGWYQNFLATAFYTGARVGELFALKWQNINFAKKRIYIDSTRGDYEEGSTKTNKARYIPIFENLLPYLKNQRRKTGMKTYVFLTEFGKDLRPSNVREYQWKPLLKRLHLPYRTMYQTRHTFATTLLNSKKFSMNEIASMLGHSNIQMLIKHYNKYMEDEISKIDTSFEPFCNGLGHSDAKSA